MKTYRYIKGGQEHVVTGTQEEIDAHVSGKPAPVDPAPVDPAPVDPAPDAPAQGDLL